MRVRPGYIVRVDVLEHFPTVVYVVVILLADREEPRVLPGTKGTGQQGNKVEVLRRYKFLLVFENNDQ